MLTVMAKCNDSCFSGDGQSLSTAQVQTSDAQSRSASQSEQSFGVHGNAEAGGQGAVYESEDRVSSKKPVAAETVKLNILAQAASLNDRVSSDHVHHQHLCQASDVFTP